MKTIKLFPLVFAAAFSLQACNSEQKGDSSVMAADSTLDTLANQDASSIAPEETEFIQLAAVGGMMEVEAGNMALQKSKNDQVKAFAKMMVTDHTKANADLQRIASAKGLNLPATFPAEQQKHIDVLQEQSDRGFDRMYMEMMVSDHIKTLELFRQGAKAKDADIRTFASQTLPVLEGHYKEANALNTSIQKQKMNNGDDNANVERDEKKLK